jgi:hypothetical protein
VRYVYVATSFVSRMGVLSGFANIGQRETCNV